MTLRTTSLSALLAIAAATSLLLACGPQATEPVEKPIPADTQTKTVQLAVEGMT